MAQKPRKNMPRWERWLREEPSATSRQQLILAFCRFGLIVVERIPEQFEKRDRKTMAFLFSTPKRAKSHIAATRAGLEADGENSVLWALQVPKTILQES
jgi:hypothetical protein